MYKNILSFYRARDWAKSLGFCVLGLTTIEFLPITNPFLFFLGIVQGCFLFSFLFSLNDFGDYIVHNEENFIGKLIRKPFSKFSALLLCFLPLILSMIVLAMNLSINYFTFYFFFVILSIAYSVPKIRLRDIPIIDIVCNVSFYSLIFLQSCFFINTQLTYKTYFLLFWTATYLFSQEIIHQISHFQIDKKMERISTVILIGKKNSINLLKFTFFMPFLGGIIIAILFQRLRIFATIMILSSLLRLFYTYRFKEKIDFNKLRNRLGGMIEGGLYLILNVLKD